jgi:diguanylate cyclase (GGDEF)-like protein
LVAQVLDREKGEASAVVARVGGEEFAAMLPGMTLGQAMQLAERMRGAVQSVQSPLTEAGGVLTISIGLAAALPSEGTGVKSALIQADRLLYAAKRGGRNRVCGAALSGDAGEVVPA